MNYLGGQVDDLFPKDVKEILNIIPKRYPDEILDAAAKEEFIEYLRNPCVVEMRYAWPDGQIHQDYRLRFALSYRTIYENTPGWGIS